MGDWGDEMLSQKVDEAMHYKASPFRHHDETEIPQWIGDAPQECGLPKEQKKMHLMSP